MLLEREIQLYKITQKIIEKPKANEHFFVIVASYVRHMLYVLSLSNTYSDSKLTCYVVSWGNAGLREHLHMLYATNTVLIHLSFYTTIF